MRCIDADKLYPDCLTKTGRVAISQRQIAEAPTIQPNRQTGEWIEKVERRGCFAGDKTVYSYTCPFCGVKEFKKYPFCHCGADMRVKDELGGRE